MIQSITVTNHLGEALTLTLTSPEESGLIIASADGLGPPKANIAMTDMSGRDGSVYNSARAGYRNIILKLYFMLAPTIEAARLKSYKYFPIKRNVTLRIITDERDVTVQGYVESNEPAIFDKQTFTQVSIICPGAYLNDTELGVTVFSAVTNLFEFPFSNESTTVALLEMSELTVETEKTILYTGDAPVGVIFHVHALGSASGLTFTNSRTLETLAINSATLIALTGADFTLGDDLYISTIKGDKYAILIRGSTTYNVLNALGTNPTWFQLEKGDNIFAYTATSGLSNLTFRALYDIAYEGV